MEPRFHPRFPTDLPVVLNQLEGEAQLVGQLEDISDSGISSLFKEALTPGVSVKLELLGLTLYGHIVYCTPANNTFRTGIYVEPALLDSSNITELVRDFITSSTRRS